MSLVSSAQNGRQNAAMDGLDGGAAVLARFVASQVDAPPADARTSGQAGQILSAARARAASRRQARRTVSTLGALAAAGFVGWAAVNGFRPKLTYTVDGTAPSPSGYVLSSAAHDPELAFSDGTSIRVMPRTRARVLDVGRRGARLVLEDGRAHVRVAHRRGADWQVQAGSFLIHVHGTAFFVDWNASQARLNVQMESGVVSVDGPRSSDSVVLRAGQSLSVRLDGSRMVALTDSSVASRPVTARLSGAGAGAGAVAETVAGTVAPAAVAPPVQPPPPAEPLAALPEALAPLNPPQPPAMAAPLRARWSERLAEGDAASIVAEAQRRGIPNVLVAASSEDLAALADAARFRRQDDLARRVLLTQRRRFAGTLRAEEASFLLGRLADGADGRAADALAWYDRYLREAPAGAYAAEAMGRMMLVLRRQHRTEQAHGVAVAYLRRFPRGVYARAARAMLSSDGE
ncbi:MAG: FecR family protein [Myxococcales bacterium]